MFMFSQKISNTLLYDPDLCINCGLCLVVCPHGVFAPNGRKVRLLRPEACMECGACMVNCVPKAILVESGVGCAQAMIRAALLGLKEPSCGDPEAQPGEC
jgi:ferredoxin